MIKRILILATKVICLYAVIYLLLCFIKMEFPVNILEESPIVRGLLIIPALLVLFINLLLDRIE